MSTIPIISANEEVNNSINTNDNVLRLEDIPGVSETCDLELIREALMTPEFRGFIVFLYEPCIGKPITIDDPNLFVSFYEMITEFSVGKEHYPSTFNMFMWHTVMKIINDKFGMKDVDQSSLEKSLAYFFNGPLFMLDLLEEHCYSLDEECCRMNECKDK